MIDITGNKVDSVARVFRDRQFNDTGVDVLRGRVGRSNRVPVMCLSLLLNP